MAGNDQQDQHAPMPGEIDQTGQAQDAPNPEIVDPDDLELIEARKAAEAEVAGSAGGQEGEQNQEAQQQPQGAQQGATADGEGDRQPPMIPKPRFDEVLAERDRLAREAAFLAGQVEALKTNPQQPQGQPAQPQPPEKSPHERLQEIQSQIDALAKKFDDGELTFAEMERQRRPLSDQEYAIREEIALAKVQQRIPQQPAPAQPGSDLYLDQLTARLENEHPYLYEIQPDDFAWLEHKARNELAAEGVPVKGDMGTYKLRERIAVLSDRYGEMLTGKKLELSNRQQQQPSGGQPGLSQHAQARAAKLDLAGRMPPDVTGMTGAQPAAEVTDQAIEGMSDEEIAALPRAARDRYLGITT